MKHKKRRRKGDGARNIERGKIGFRVDGEFGCKNLFKEGCWVNGEAIVRNAVTLISFLVEFAIRLNELHK